MAFRRRLSGYSAISGVVWGWVQGIPRTLMPEGGRRGPPDPDSLPRAESQLGKRAVGFETTAAYFINRLGVRVSIGVLGWAMITLGRWHVVSSQ